MSQQIAPENLYIKVSELLKAKDEEKIISVVHDCLVNCKKKVYSNSIEATVEIYAKLCVKHLKLKQLREGLSYFRAVTTGKLDSFVKVLGLVKDVADEQVSSITETFEESELEDLDSEDTPDKYLVLSSQDSHSLKDKAITTLKFAWRVYKTLIDFTKVNNKLLEHYYKNLKTTFAFCRKYSLKLEFKRLSDSVRGYLQILLKSKTVANVPNKVDLSNPEVIKSLIQIRISLLETSISLQQWQEAFKTAEDIVLLMGKFSSEQKSKQTPDKLGFEYFYFLSKLMESSEYHLFNGIALLNVRTYFIRIEKLAKGKENEGNAKAASTLRKTISLTSLNEINNLLLISYVLASSQCEGSKEFIKLGKEEVEGMNNRDFESNEKILQILKLPFFPTKEYLHHYINSNQVKEHAHPALSQIFDLLSENQTLSISSIKKAVTLSCDESTELTSKHHELLKKQIIHRGLRSLHHIYKNVSFARLESLFQSDFQILEEIIVEDTRRGFLRFKIDFQCKLVHIKDPSPILLSDIVQKVENVVSQLYSSKVNEFKEFIKVEGANQTTNSLISSNARVEKISQFIGKQENELKIKESLIYSKINENIVNDEKDKEQKEKELIELKNLEVKMREKKELDLKLKNYLVEKLSEFTTTISIDQDGSKVKYKLTDLAKDLDKFTSDQLVAAYTEEEINNQEKQKRLFKEIQKKIDYDIRAKRKIEMSYFTDYFGKETRIITEELQAVEAKRQKVLSLLGPQYKIIDNFFEKKVIDPLNPKFQRFIQLRKQYLADKAQCLSDELFYIVYSCSEEMKVEFEKEELRKAVINPHHKRDEPRNLVRNNDRNNNPNNAMPFVAPLEFTRSKQFNENTTLTNVNSQSQPSSTTAFSRSNKYEDSKPNAIATPIQTIPGEFKRGANFQSKPEPVKEQDTAPVFFNKQKTETKQVIQDQPPTFINNTKPPTQTQSLPQPQPTTTQNQTNMISGGGFGRRIATESKTEPQPQVPQFSRGSNAQPKPAETKKEEPKQQTSTWRK